jgi:hypothetical protein
MPKQQKVYIVRYRGRWSGPWCDKEAYRRYSSAHREKRRLADQDKMGNTDYDVLPLDLHD